MFECYHSRMNGRAGTWTMKKKLFYLVDAPLTTVR